MSYIIASGTGNGGSGCVPFQQRINAMYDDKLNGKVDQATCPKCAHTKEKTPQFMLKSRGFNGCPFRTQSTTSSDIHRQHCL